MLLQTQKIAAVNDSGTEMMAAALGKRGFNFSDVDLVAHHVKTTGQLHIGGAAEQLVGLHVEVDVRREVLHHAYIWHHHPLVVLHRGGDGEFLAGRDQILGHFAAVVQSVQRSWPCQKLQDQQSHCKSCHKSNQKLSPFPI